MDHHPPNKKEFLNYIHDFRGLAILFIVGIHTVISINWNNIVTKKFIMAIANNGTILFVFIAGFLFYYLYQNKFNYKEYLKKKFLYVILPYLIISIPAIVDKLYFDPGNHWWMNENFKSLPDTGKIFYMLATGRHSGALWFIPMITLFYFVSPVFIWYGRNRISHFLTPILCLAVLFTFRFGYHSNILLSFIHFSPVYLFGIWAAKFRDILFRYYKFLIWPLVFIYAGITVLESLEIIPFDYYMELRDAHYAVYTLNISMIKALLFCILLLLIFYRLKNKAFPVLRLLGDYSFGIYFLHIYLINIIEKLSRHGFFFVSMNVWKYFIYLILIVMMNILIIRFVKPFLGRNSRMFIGS